MKTILVEPFYGWGWDTGGGERETPPPFRALLETASPGRWTGTIIEPGHEFDSYGIEMVQRHVEWSGDVDVTIHPAGAGGKTTFGWASVPTDGILQGRPRHP